MVVLGVVDDRRGRRSGFRIVVFETVPRNTNPIVHLKFVLIAPWGRSIGINNFLFSID